MDVVENAFELRSMGWRLGRLVGIVGVDVVRLALWSSFSRAASRVALVGEEFCKCILSVSCMGVCEYWMDCSRLLVVGVCSVGELEVVDGARLVVRPLFSICASREEVVRRGKSFLDCVLSASWTYDGKS